MCELSFERESFWNQEVTYWTDLDLDIMFLRVYFDLSFFFLLIFSLPYSSSKSLLALYYSLAYPYLTYCNVAWSSTYCSTLNYIYLLQKYIVRLIIKRAHYLGNTAPLFYSLKVLDKYSINYFYVATFMYSYHHNLRRSSFRNLFKQYLTRFAIMKPDQPLSRDHIPHLCQELIFRSSVSFIEDQKSGIL